jgi:hypothetical protein
LPLYNPARLLAEIATADAPSNGRLMPSTVPFPGFLHLVRWWQRLIDTLLGMNDQQYPQGWRENSKMTDHNNYDVVELFSRGWPRLRPDQRRQASQEIPKCLTGFFQGR